MSGDLVQVPENARWRYRVAAVNLRLSLVGKPISPAAQLMLDALDNLAAGRAPTAPETPVALDVGQQPRALDLVADLACASRALTVTALGLVVAGIGFAGAVVYVAVSTMGATP
jgi:hypothetical protein